MIKHPGWEGEYREGSRHAEIFYFRPFLFFRYQNRLPENQNMISELQDGVGFLGHSGLMNYRRLLMSLKAK